MRLAKLANREINVTLKGENILEMTENYFIFHLYVDYKSNEKFKDEVLILPEVQENFIFNVQREINAKCKIEFNSNFSLIDMIEQLTQNKGIALNLVNPLVKDGFVIFEEKSVFVFEGDIRFQSSYMIEMEGFIFGQSLTKEIYGFDNSKITSIVPVIGEVYSNWDLEKIFDGNASKSTSYSGGQSKENDIVSFIVNFSENIALPDFLQFNFYGTSYTPDRISLYAVQNGLVELVYEDTDIPNQETVSFQTTDNPQLTF